MKLYLSSYGLGSTPQQFAELVGKNKKVAVIANAWDASTPERRVSGLLERFKSVEDIGLQPEELDLRNYFNDPERLAEDLARFGAVWVQGGNSFVLLRAMHKCNFKAMAIDRINNEDLVYAGYSAGACVAGPTLQGIELVDDPYVVPDGYNDEVQWKGLGLIDFCIAPHYRSDHPESAAIEKVVDYFQTNHIPYQALHDNQSIIVNGQHLAVVG